jgi:16S rRNA C1402 N4-methylase RsmH
MKSHFHLVNKKPIEARESEIIHNNRARSAKLRVIEKVLKDET